MTREAEPAAQVDADAPRDRRWRSAYAALELAQLHSGAARGALYARDDERIRLLALQGIDQRGLELVDAMWRTAEPALTQGQPYGRTAPPTLLLPCTDPGGLAGLLLLQWPGGTDARGVPGLRALSQVLATALRRLNDGPITSDAAPVVWRKLDTPVSADVPDDVLDDPRSSALVLRALLEREEWNVTRVSRVLGVTRMTVYNRMRKLGVARERVRKTPPRRRRAARDPLTAVAMPAATGDDSNISGHAARSSSGDRHVQPCGRGVLASAPPGTHPAEVFSLSASRRSRAVTFTPHVPPALRPPRTTSNRSHVRRRLRSPSW